VRRQSGWLKVPVTGGAAHTGRVIRRAAVVLITRARPGDGAAGDRAVHYGAGRVRDYRSAAARGLDDDVQRCVLLSVRVGRGLQLDLRPGHPVQRQRLRRQLGHR